MNHHSDHILALNRDGVQFLQVVSHVSLTILMGIMLYQIIPMMFMTGDGMAVFIC